MKPDILLLRLAVWLVERTSNQPAAEAFTGDLLELFAQGRSPWWCLSQAFSKAVTTLEYRLRTLQLPLWYSIAFISLHPLWQRLYAPSVNSLLTRYRGTAPWPGSALLEIAAGLLPALFFLCTGIFVYLLLRPQTLRALTPVSLLLSLNVAAATLSALIILRLASFQHDLRLLSRADFYYPFVHTRFSLLLLVSLWIALATLPPPPHRRRPNHRILRLLHHRGALRLARSFGWLTMLGLELPGNSQ